MPCDPAFAERHRFFIRSHLTGGLTAVLGFSIYLLIFGSPHSSFFAVLPWFLTPLILALFLARTGAFRSAHLFSAMNLIGLVVVTAGLTGGILSWVIVWLAIPPLEAALSGDRRVVIISTVVTVIAGIGLYAATIAGYVAAPHAGILGAETLALVCLISAGIYGGLIALAIQRMHHEAQIDIAASEERYRLLAANAGDLITRHDADGRVVFASHASRQILGVSHKLLLGDGLLERVHVADRPAYLKLLSDCRNDGIFGSLEFRLQRSHVAVDPGQRTWHSDPGYCWAEMSCRPFQMRSGEKGLAPVEVVAVTRDVSQRKRQEAELVEARDMAESLNKAKTRFLANMSHELRTPLNAIIGFSQILDSARITHSYEARHSEYIAIIKESGEHLLGVVNDLLDLSRIEAGRFELYPEPFELSKFVQTCLEFVRPSADEKALRLANEVSSELPDLTADRKAVKQILLNLLSNAVKFSHERGTITVVAEVEGPILVLQVLDEGVGIDKTEIDRLGTPFTQADTSYNRIYDGAGLGLSVVMGLVELHGGTFDLVSEIGKGTTVSVHLPLDGLVIEEVERKLAAAGDAHYRLRA